ncbi:MAG: hypothetical protein COA78_11945 [Blastopirellula sp.]|nr:MAG: hypothetical protein COA78_11945 [Blastopirellula sp.]
MKYICNVIDGDNVKHVIETSAGNVEVVFGKHEYNKYKSYLFKDVKIRDDSFNVNASNQPFSTILLACELVKFIRENGH